MTQRYKGTVEDYRSITASRINKAGYFNDGKVMDGGWAWWNDKGDKTASIGIQGMEKRALRVMYNSGGKGYDYEIRLDWLPCHLGGERVMFRCPRCHKRCAKLLITPMCICRQCANVNYRSQQSSHRDSANDQSWKLRAKLGCEWGLFDCSAHHIPKPKWMRWKTYYKITNRIAKCDSTSLEGLMKYVNSMGLHLDD